ncbi:helix-turn-helix domain-containing protein [Hymenobacter oligotrophus]|nr:helix-turn-helix transcriptional regulator [Hymenobacter oligotrophus]
MFSAARIAAIRKSKGYSQEVLAEHSGVSLRTIQRVEQGDTVPRGHTLQALAAALGVSLEDFCSEPQLLPTPPSHAPREPAPAAAALRADPQFLQLLNLSALSLLIFPLLNVVVPLLLWRARRHHILHVAEVGSRVLGFQLLWQVGCFFAYLLLAFGNWVAAHYQRPVFAGGFVALFVLSYVLNVTVVAYYARRLRQGRLDVYPVGL